MTMTKEIMKLSQSFTEALRSLDKKKAVQLATDALDAKTINIVDLYTYVLAPGLSGIASNDTEQKISIWEEHVQSSIVRTVLEIAFPYVLKEAKAPSIKPLNAIVFCLEEEYHEMGARMTTDFLTLLGMKATFIGANTPKNEILDAMKTLTPDLVCVSVTNYFHLTRLKDLIEQIHANFKDETYKIVVGGYAVEHTPHAKEILGADYYAASFEDLNSIKEALL